jgi:hypothetical protein
MGGGFELGWGKLACFTRRFMFLISLKKKYQKKIPKKKLSIK